MPVPAELATVPLISPAPPSTPQLGLTAGWYGNNWCAATHNPHANKKHSSKHTSQSICAEKHTADSKFYAGDVKALNDFGFDSVKLDGCGVQTDMEQYYELMNASGRWHELCIATCVPAHLCTAFPHARQGHHR